MALIRVLISFFPKKVPPVFDHFFQKFEKNAKFHEIFKKSAEKTCFFSKFFFSKGKMKYRFLAADAPLFPVWGDFVVAWTLVQIPLNLGCVFGVRCLLLLLDSLGCFGGCEAAPVHVVLVWTYRRGQHGGMWWPQVIIFWHLEARSRSCAILLPNVLQY